MKTAVIIQARLGSSRLPAKVLLPLPNCNSVLEEVVTRCYEIEDVDDIVVAAPDKDIDIICDHICLATLVGGSEHNVLSRYYEAANRVCADTIVRITADCPLIDPHVCFGVLNLHKVSGAHYTSNVWPARQWPPGYDCEVFSMEMLAKAHYAKGKTLEDMEHVTPLIRKFAEQENGVYLYKSFGLVDERPRTLDTLEDYRRIWGMMEDEIGDGRTAA